MEGESLHEPFFIQFCAKHLGCVLSHNFLSIITYQWYHSIFVKFWKFLYFFEKMKIWKLKRPKSFFFYTNYFNKLENFFFLRRINLRISLWNHEPKLLTILMGRCNFAHTVLVRCKRVEPTLPTLFLLINKYNFFF